MTRKRLIQVTAARLWVTILVLVGIGWIVELLRR
jgi:hypothetical protein